MNANDILASLFWGFIAACILCLIILANAIIRNFLRNRQFKKDRKTADAKRDEKLGDTKGQRLIE